MTRLCNAIPSPRRTALLLGLLVASACSDAERPDGAPGAPPPEPPLPPPAEAFSEMETGLLDATALRVEFQVTATGSLTAEMSGLLLVGGSGRARLEAAGTFGGDPVDVFLVSDGQRMRLSSNGTTVESETPPALGEALVLGLTRMGVLHNLARLVAGQAPDHAEGGPDEWILATDFGRNGRAITFALEVEGTRTGAAELFVAPVAGVPGERRQTVSFPDGDMEVVERYGAVSLGGGWDEAAFVLQEG